MRKDKAMAELKEAPKPKSGNGATQPKDFARQATTPVMKIGGSPFAYMRRFADEMDRIFEKFDFHAGLRMPGFFDRDPGRLRREAGFVPGEWLPLIDVLEKDGQIVVRADLPGLSKEDVKVDVTDDMLTIQGERKHEANVEREGHRYCERSYGSFYRCIPLPEGAVASKSAATFQNGVLEVTVPAPARVAENAHRLEVRERK
jgi:HSP20 family protein